MSKQILLFVLEIQNTIFLLLRHQRSSHRGVELVHYKRYGGFLLYGHGGNCDVLYIWLC